MSGARPGRVRFARGAAGLTCALLALLAVAGPARSQAVSGAFDDFKIAPGTAIQIDADSLVVSRKQKKVTFSGNVIARRGALTLHSKTLVIQYRDVNSATAKSRTEITRLEALGGVRVVTRNQTATGDRGAMDMRTRKIVLTGNVVLTQGKTVVRGSRLNVDMNSGVSRLVGGAGGGGRVQGVFRPAGGG